MTAFELPPWLARSLESNAGAMPNPGDGPPFDFTGPIREPALIAADSISWRVFKNPVSLFIGGVAAVILELGEPRVRTGVWEHSAFRADPARRLRRTGLAAMVTVYGPRSRAEAMIARVVTMHARVAGRTPCGLAYHANDPDLLNWVQATASFGFIEAYRRYVRALATQDVDCFYREAGPSARLYGVLAPPDSALRLDRLFRTMRPSLEPSAILREFLEILTATPLFPGALRAIQSPLVRAAVEIVPAPIRERLRIARDWRLHPWERPFVQAIARLADGLVLPSSPPVQSCLRLGLEARHLFGPWPTAPSR